jgi:diacylglycerol kinase family enzyme
MRSAGMRRFQGKDNKPRYRPLFYLLVNHHAAGYSKKKVEFLTGELSRAGLEYRILEPSSADEAVFQVKRIINTRPEGIIACGGDSTVNLAAQHLIRRSPGLGIFPLGRFNNFYRSLFGDPDAATAVRHILSRQSRPIDHGLAGGRFFLGSIGLGLIPELHELLDKKGIPRFGISWSRCAATAAAAVSPQEYLIKIDAFRFNISPVLLNLNLLSFTLGLPLVSPSIDEDGKGEIIFDIGRGKAILSSYVRQIYKRKYLYSDEIRMFRGSKISIAPVKGKKLYIDGEITTCRTDSLEIEIFEKKIRIYQKKKE